MILSHMAPPCLNRSPHRAIWTHFKSSSVIFITKCLDQVLDLVQLVQAYLVQDWELHLVHDMVQDSEPDIFENHTI